MVILYGVLTPLVIVSPRSILTIMNLLVILIVLMLLFGGGGFYLGGPMVGGGGFGLILLILLVLFFTGGLSGIALPGAQWVSMLIGLPFLGQRQC